jgi:hypothetical protein
VSFSKFEHRYPAHQNAVDLFTGKWASDLSKVAAIDGTGGADLFAADPRPGMAALALGTAEARLDGMSVLELGPLEAGHSYQLERLGAASVLGIEANAEAYLKCLIVKELLGLERCRFLLGDVLEFTAAVDRRFDLVFCSGILYHMSRPISLIKQICDLTDKCFVWTHYYDAESGDKEGARTRRLVCEFGFEADYYELEYSGQQAGTFWGGNADVRAWMSRESIIACFRRFGLSKVEVMQDTPSHPNGAAMSFAAARG